LTTAIKSRAAERRAGRSGRPPRDQAGEVEERILDAAQKVFLARGFEGASVDEVAEVAHAGKPTIYARFPHKDALFHAVMERMVERRFKTLAAAKTSATAGATLAERLSIFASLLLRAALEDETIALVRATIAEARRFPDLASSVHRMLRERGTHEIARLLSELVTAGAPRSLPAPEPQRLEDLARRFAELAIQPPLMRALFGESSALLRIEIDAHVRQAVDFFLAAYGRVGGAQV